MLPFRVKLASQPRPAPRRPVSPIAATLTKPRLASSGSASLSSSQERSPHAFSSLAFGLTPLLATHPGFAPLTPFPATLTKTRPAKSNACHTSEKNQGVCRPSWCVRFSFLSTFNCRLSTSSSFLEFPSPLLVCSVFVPFDFQLSTVNLFFLSRIPITSLLGAFHASFPHHPVVS